jgi:hypothetical protein
MFRRTWKTPVILAAIVLLVLAITSFAAGLPVEPLLDKGFRQMYNMDFAGAHVTFAEYERANPESAMGPISDAAAYLFAEFDRLNILRSEYWIKDESFWVVNKPKGDPALKKEFEDALTRGQQLAANKLKNSPTDLGAMLASTMGLGLHADYLALIEKKNLTALSEVKQSRMLAEKLLAAHPDVYDAYIAPGIENYLLSQKPIAIRWFLRLSGAETDRQIGITKTGLTAEKGHYFLPYARLLLAIADLRDNNREGAKEKLQWLAKEYPGNHLYREELERLK